jgi:hypothetical protein
VCERRWIWNNGAVQDRECAVLVKLFPAKTKAYAGFVRLRKPARIMK